MASFACSSLLSIKLSSQISLKVDQSWQAMQPQSSIGASSAEHIGLRMTKIGAKISNRWSFMRGAEVVVTSDVVSFIPNRKLCGISSSLLTNSQIASSIFTLGTVAVLPFYTLMIFAPKANLTRRSMESSIPYIVLGALYAYLLDISWTPDTIRMMFASKYWLPELPGMVKLFSSELTLASAWIHLLAVDLFAARQVYFDGLENDIETRHSVSLCLLFCPIGVASHVITKVLTKRAAQNTNRKFD